MSSDAMTTWNNSLANSMPVPNCVASRGARVANGGMSLEEKVVKRAPKTFTKTDCLSGISK